MKLIYFINRYLNIRAEKNGNELLNANNMLQMRAILPFYSLGIFNLNWQQNVA